MRKVRTGIAGLGRVGYIHARNLAFAIPGAELTAVCSLKQEELYKARKELGAVSCYGDFDRMLENKSLEALVIASPSDKHAEQLRKGLQAGLHVFCEKPLATNLKDCKASEEMVDRHPGQVFMVGFMRRYDPSYRYVRRKMKEGYLGKPILLRSYSIDPAESIAGTLSYLPHSAGQFMDMAIHDIDLACWLLESKPRSVYAIGGCFAYEDFARYGDGDNVAAIMQLQNDAMVFLYAGRAAPHGYHVETEIIGTHATIRIGAVPQKNQVELIDTHGIRRECPEGFPQRFQQAFLAEMEEFIQCILESREPEVTVADGTLATYLAGLATMSFRKNELIKL